MLYWSICRQSRRTTCRLGCIAPTYSGCYVIGGTAELAFLGLRRRRSTLPRLFRVYCGQDGAVGGRAWIDPAASGLHDLATFGSGPRQQSDSRDSELTCAAVVYDTDARAGINHWRPGARFIARCRKTVRASVANTLFIRAVEIPAVV